MKRFLITFLILLTFPVLAQTGPQGYFTVASVAALKAMTGRPLVVEIIDANPGIFNGAASACGAADDIFQITPTSGPAGWCYTRIATPYSVGKASPVSSVLTAGGTGTPAFVATLPATNFPALTGDITTSAGALATTLATVATGATTGSSTAIPVITFTNKGLVTGVSTAAVVAPAGTLSGATLAAGVTASSLTSTGSLSNLNIDAGAAITWTNRSKLFSTLDGTILLTNNATSGATGIYFGGTGVGNILQLISGTLTTFRLGDNSANAPIAAAAGTFSGPLTATLANTASTSAVCYNTGTGLLTYNSTVGTCTVSTIAAKNVVGELSPLDGFDIVMAMEPARYDLKIGQPTYVPGEQVGFIAERVYQLDPRLVAVNPDGSVAGVRYEQYTAVLTAAFKKLKADNDNLRNEIETIKKAIQ